MFHLTNSLFKPKADLAKLVQDGAMIVDVRTEAEYQAGHIEGSRNIPLDTITREIAVLQELNKPVVTVCRSGNRSEMAKSILTKAGIPAYNGGAWTNLKSQLR